jgi:hypothetical protein
MLASGVGSLIDRSRRERTTALLDDHYYLTTANIIDQ